jgi:hypothetical protein
MTAHPAASLADACAAYEGLRAQAVSGSPSGAPSGLVLFLRGGLASWLTHQNECLASGLAAIGSESAPLPPATAPVLPNETKAGIVQVLASIAMAARMEIGL